MTEDRWTASDKALGRLVVLAGQKWDRAARALERAELAETDAARGYIDAKRHARDMAPPPEEGQ